MEAIQVADLLNRIAMGDNRRVEKATVVYWYDLVGDLDFVDAVEAVRQHRRTSTDYLQAAHVRQGVKRIREERIGDHIKEIPPYADPDDVAGALAHERSWRKRLADGEVPPTLSIESAPLPALDRLVTDPPTRDVAPPRPRNAKSVSCPWCRVAPGERCVADGRPVSWTHAERQQVSGDGPAPDNTARLEAERQRQLRALEAMGAAADGPQ